MEQPGEDLSKKYTLEGLINDPTFETETPELFKEFLAELKEREPALYEKHYGERERKKASEKEANIFDLVVPIIKQGQKPYTSVKDDTGAVINIPVEIQHLIHPIFDGLGIVFGIDRGSHYEWMQNKHLHPSMTIQDLINKAYDNLLKQTSGQLQIYHITEGMGMLTKGNRLESSFMLAQFIWDNIFKTFNTTDMVFSIPTQDVLVFCDIKRTDDIKLLKEKTTETFNNPAYPKKISPNIYRKTGSGGISIYTS